MTPPTTDRRTLLRTAAWTTPAVLAASAAPAFARSGPVTFTVDSGTTAIAPVFNLWLGPVFTGFTIQPSSALAANDLKVTLTATSPSTTAFLMHDAGRRFTASPSPWVAVESAGVNHESLTFSYPSPVPAGSTVTLSGGLAMVLGSPNAVIYDPTVTVTVSAPGATSVPRVFS